MSRLQKDERRLLRVAWSRSRYDSMRLWVFKFEQRHGSADKRGNHFDVCRSSAQTHNPKVAVTPSGNLVDGEMVKVTVSGFGQGGSSSYLSAQVLPTSIVPDVEDSLQLNHLVLLTRLVMEHGPSRCAILLQ